MFTLTGSKCSRMSATQDLRSCLLSLCEIIENILPNLQKGIISPELFRLAKQDDSEAIKVTAKNTGKIKLYQKLMKSLANDNALLSLDF